MGPYKTLSIRWSLFQTAYYLCVEVGYHLLDVNKMVVFLNDQSDRLKKGQIVISQRTTMANILNNQIKVVIFFNSTAPFIRMLNNFILTSLLNTWYWDLERSSDTSSISQSVTDLKNKTDFLNTTVRNYMKIRELKLDEYCS